MSERYVFRKIKEDEVSSMFELIRDRMHWQDQHNIKQWNTSHYDEIYPLSYYDEQRKNQQLYILQDMIHQQIVCGAVLFDHDQRWLDVKPALYVHNFARKSGYRGVGSIFLKHVEKLAKRQGKTYIRLDSALDNEKLASYYEHLGFQSVGTCKEGTYVGILREKKLK